MSKGRVRCKGGSFWNRCKLLCGENAGGVRFSESDLELLALAEYVKELETALEKQRALSASQQQATPAQSHPGEQPQIPLRQPKISTFK